MKTLNTKYILLLALVAVACSTLELNGDSLVQLKGSADPSSTTIGNALISNDVTFTQARVVITDIKFRSGADCSGSDESEYEGPYVLDLLTQKSNPTLEQVQLSKGKYCRFEFKLDKLKDNDLPSGISEDDEIVDQSVIIKGTDNHTSTPFIVTLDRNETYELDSETSSGFELAPDQATTLFLVFNLSKLFDTVNLSAIAADSDGTIHIDKNNNPAAFDIIKDNLKRFSRLQRDDNNNVTLDSDDEVIAGDNSN